MGKLAITGGKPVRKKPFTAWPAYTQQEARGLQKVLTSRNWGGYPFPNKIARRLRAEVRPPARREVWAGGLERHRRD